ncbi:MAG: response regulator [Anaerolineales bacterium]|nr:response regulator [Anaerolineales bacterium]
MAGRILVVDDDPMNVKLVETALAKDEYEIITAGDGKTALKMAEEHNPDVILLDVMMPEMDGFEVCSRLRKKPATAHKPIMMLTALNTVEERIKGFDAGADDYLPKPFAPTELQARVKVLFRRAAPVHVEKEIKEAKIIAVFSLRGGVGISSLAANLAAGLTQLWSQPCVLVDLALNAGQSALMFNLPFRRSWENLAVIPPAEIDIHVLDDVLLQHSSDTHILASSPRPEQNELIDGEKVTRVLSLLSKEYNYLVLDLPHDFHDTTIAGLDLAHEILLVLTPDLASVRSTVCALDVFNTLEYDPQKIRLVLNWTFQRNGLPRKDIEAAVKHPIDFVIPFAPEPFVMAINLGKPTVIDNPKSPLGALYEDFAFILSKENNMKERPQFPSDAWERTVSRLKQRQQKG